MNPNSFIRPTHIISVFTNEIDWNKVKQYAKEMKEQNYFNGGISFPPISGYYGYYSQEDEPLCNDLEFIHIDIPIGEKVFYVTDGHHRSFAANIAGIYLLETEIEYQYKRCSVS